MPKLVKLTDEVGEILEQRAKQDGVSVAAEVKLLLEGKDDNNINTRLDKLAAYLETKFAELKNSIEDTTVDRIAPRPRKQKQTFLPGWPTARTVLYDIATESDYVNPAVYDAFVNSDMADEFSYYVQDGQLWYTWYGADFPILNLTPAITNFLTEKGVL